MRLETASSISYVFGRLLGKSPAILSPVQPHKGQDTGPLEYIRDSKQVGLRLCCLLPKEVRVLQPGNLPKTASLEFSFPFRGVTLILLAGSIPFGNIRRRGDQTYIHNPQE